MSPITRFLALASVASLGLAAWVAPHATPEPGPTASEAAGRAGPSVLTGPLTGPPAVLQPHDGPSSGLPAALTLSETQVSRQSPPTTRAAAAPFEWAPYEVRAKACRTGRVVLTFDDGPHPDRTRELRTWLTRHDIPATFFVVGSRVPSSPGLVRSLSSNPRLFTVANHTWRHPDLRHLSGPQVRHELASTRKAINRTGAPASTLMRPPYGALNPRAEAAIRAERLRPVLWNVDSADWTGGNRHQIAGRILAQLRPKRANVILQHDGINNSYESVRAVPIVVKEAQRRGYCFVPLKPDGQAGSMLRSDRSQPSGTARSAGTATP